MLTHFVSADYTDSLHTICVICGLRTRFFFNLALLIIFVLKFLEGLAFTRGIFFSAGARVSTCESEVHLRARRRELHSFFQFLDRSIDLAQLEQHTSQHVARSVQLRRELHCLLREW